MRYKNLSLIVAIGENNEMGKDNDLLFHIKKDIQIFREVTTNKSIIMGRKTFNSLPKMLVNRKHIVLTKDKNWTHEDVFVFNEINSLLLYIEKNPTEEFVVIGGAQIYKELLPYTYKAYISHIKKTAIADTYFPKIEESWDILSKEDFDNFTHIIYEIK